MPKRHHFTGTSGPPAKTWHKAKCNLNAPSHVRPSSMAIDLPLVTVATSTDRDISKAALSSIAKLVPMVLAEVNWQDNHTDTAFENLTDAIYGIVKTFTHISRPDADNLVDMGQFKENVAKKHASGFVNLLRKALKENNLEFWHPIVTHVKPKSSNFLMSELQEEGGGPSGSCVYTYYAQPQGIVLHMPNNFWSTPQGQCMP
ncbi:hypothetical protein EDB83DRAFT_2312265 [Lactarius deliciosus]|nr:hypothetical protein EDB83DRAFT_2312265 [Lactarius deliciosus]